MDRTSVHLTTASIRRARRHGQLGRHRAQPGFMRWTGDRSAGESRLAQLARFGLAITGKPLLELKPEDA